ncbi:MAG: TolC family protein [Phycisphaerae bacterium]
MALAGLLALWAAGCTPDQYADQADRAAGATLRMGHEIVFGQPREFELEYEAPRTPADSIVLDGEKLPLNGSRPIRLDLSEALTIAFRSSRRLQDRKEELYRQALAVANARRGWDWALVDGQLTGDFDHEKVAKGGDTTTGGAAVGPTLRQRFIHGGVLALGATLDLATDFMGGSDSTIGSLLGANFTQPLLQGAWRGLAYEQQYRLERNFVFSVFEYERFTQEFGTQIISDYYNVIRRQNELENEKATIERLRTALKLTSVLVVNGEATVVDQDQAVRRLLTAELRFESSRQDYQDTLDRFKVTLGLPARSQVELEYKDELTKLLAIEPEKFGFDEGYAIHTALMARPDVLVQRAQIRDARRNVTIAADKFLPQLDLELGITAPGTEKREFWRMQFDRHTRTAKLRLEYNLDQTDNRDAYRLSLIAMDKARRDLAQFTDQVRLDVRQEFRTLRRAVRSYEVQVERVRVARRSRKLALLKQREGQASTRDVLDAEEELRSAQIGLTAEIVRYETTRLRFLATLGLLDVTEDGRIHVRENPNRFDRIAERYPYVGS